MDTLVDEPHVVSVNLLTSEAHGSHRTPLISDETLFNDHSTLTVGIDEYGLIWRGTAIELRVKQQTSVHPTITDDQL